MNLGERITVEREKRGWSITKLAERARMDIKTLSAIESRKSERSKFAPQIAKALGISTDDLLGEAGPRTLMAGSPSPEYQLSEFDRETLDFARAFRELTSAERHRWMTQVLLIGEKIEKGRKQNP